MYKALFSLAYYGMLRVGELTEGPHCIKGGNIHVGGNKDKLLVVLYSSKTHGKESCPQKLKISAAPTTRKAEKFFCPFKSVVKYMDLKMGYLDDEEQFFTLIDPL